MNALGLVRESLVGADQHELVVLVDLNDPHGPVYSDDLYYDVFEIRVADRIVRSYEESTAAWMGDQKLLPFLGVFSIASGLIILRHERNAWRSTGSNQEK
jgi:hypothetical protein